MIDRNSKLLGLGRELEKNQLKLFTAELFSQPGKLEEAYSEYLSLKEDDLGEDELKEDEWNRFVQREASTDLSKNESFKNDLDEPCIDFNNLCEPEFEGEYDDFFGTMSGGSDWEEDA